jgi:hypothetical protein
MRLPVVNEAANAAEYFVHHEDVRRANGRGPRPADPTRDQVLWRQVQLGGARGVSKHAGLPVQLERPDGERVGREDPAGVLVRGTVDELFLLGFRPEAALVLVDGPAESVRQFQRSMGRTA